MLRTDELTCILYEFLSFKERVQQRHQDSHRSIPRCMEFMRAELSLTYNDVISEEKIELNHICAGIVQSTCCCTQFINSFCNFFMNFVHGSLQLLDINHEIQFFSQSLVLSLNSHKGSRSVMISVGVNLVNSSEGVK